MTAFLTGAWIGALPELVLGALFVISSLCYAFRRAAAIEKLLTRFSFRQMVRIAVYFRIAYAGLLTVLQYVVWSSSGTMGNSFLNAPLGSAVPVPTVHELPWVFNHPLGYFIFYSYGRFWLSVLVTLLVAWVFHNILHALERYNGRFFEAGEVELGYLMALIVGWPQFVIFVPLVFLFVVVVALVRLLLLRKQYTTLGWPFIYAALATVLLGAKLLSLSGLMVLSV